MTRLVSWLAVALLALSVAAQEKSAPRSRFTDAIEAFERSDRLAPPPPGSILFIGSSIFRLWRALPEQMAPLPVFNRAFGGSRTDEILAFMDRIVLPYRPRVIVYYCGSNDINANVPPERIALNFREFVGRVRRELPGTRILYVSINKAPQKMDRWEQVELANRLIREYCEQVKGLQFIDVNPVLFDANGSPRMELYLPDRLHLLDPAYEEFARIIRPALLASWKEVSSDQK